MLVAAQPDPESLGEGRCAVHSRSTDTYRTRGVQRSGGFGKARRCTRHRYRLGRPRSGGLSMSDAGVVVVVPVYGDIPSVIDCLRALGTTIDRSRHTVLVVNDCGPEVDAMESAILELVGQDGAFRYERNDTNLGFVGTCNRAVFDLDTTARDVLLLEQRRRADAGLPRRTRTSTRPRRGKRRCRSPEQQRDHRKPPAPSERLVCGADVRADAAGVR